MKIFLSITLFISSLPLTKKYYMDCLPEADNIKFPNVTNCRSNDPEGGYCCYLHYRNPEKDSSSSYYTTYYYYYVYYKLKENKTKLRTLFEPLSYCFGISQEGYNDIGDVIDEISDESGIDDMDIDCGIKGLKNNFIVLTNVFLLFIILF